MKRTAKFLTNIFVLAILAGVCGTIAQAQATRTWVSGVGDDANPCSRTAPCKTYAGAISKTAAKGEISTLDPGGFGAVNITKSITIEGSGTLASILAAGTNGIIINAGANDVVTLRGLKINGATTGINGIRILNAKAVHIENCFISGFTGRGISDERTVGGAALFVNNTIIKDNDGAHVSLGTNNLSFVSAVLDNVKLENSGTNAGLSVTTGAKVVIRNSVISRNSTNGINADRAGGGVVEITVENTVISHNNTGVNVSTGNPTIFLSDATIVANFNGIVPNGGSVLSFGNNKIAGNLVSNGAPTGTVLQQ